MSEERPYREAPAETPGASLVFYPAVPLSEGLLGLVAGSAMLLALVVPMATSRFVVGGLLVRSARGGRQLVRASRIQGLLRLRLVELLVTLGAASLFVTKIVIWASGTPAGHLGSSWNWTPWIVSLLQ